MSARKRSRGRNRKSGANDGQQQGQGGGGNRNKGGKRRRGGSNRRREGAGFWGDVEKLPPAQPDIRITATPDALPRSLGAPPLTGHEKIATHYFTAIYERAVTTAGALAAAGGLIEPDDLVEELGAEDSDDE